MNERCMPTWSERYRLGAEANKQLDKCCTLQELGDELGVTRANAYTESVLALGAFIWRARDRLRLQPQDGGN